MCLSRTKESINKNGNVSEDRIPIVISWSGTLLGMSKMAQRPLEVVVGSKCDHNHNRKELRKVINQLVVAG